MRDDRGQVLALVLVMMVGLLGIGALAVDVGLLLTARTEAQRVADAAALAGAAAFIHAPGDVENVARMWAKEFAAKNEVRKVPVTLRDEDIDVLMDEEKVRVRVWRTDDWGGPITTYLARVFGVGSAGVMVVAAAEAAQGATAAKCLLPLAMADRWINFGWPEWNPEEPPVGEGDYYLPPGEEGSNAYTQDDAGMEIVLKPAEDGASGDGDSKLEPSAYYFWLPEGFHGVPSIEDRIRNCPPEEEAYQIGDWLWREEGSKQAVAKILQAFQDLIDAEPDLWFDDGCKCVKDGNDNIVTNSMRVRVSPLFSPYTFTKEGSGPHFQIQNFGGVFISHLSDGPAGVKNVHAIFLGFTGFDPGGEEGTQVKVLRLVE